MKKNVKATEITLRVNNSIRRDWGEICPVTRVIPDKRNKTPKHKKRDTEMACE